MSSHFGCDGGQIQRMDWRSGQLNPLTPSPCSAQGEGALAGWASWSADGQKLAYLDQSQVRLMEADGSLSRDLGLDGALQAQPSFSRNGQQLAYTRGATPGRPEVWIANLEQNSNRKLMVGSHAAFSPGGSTLVLAGPTQTASGKPRTRPGLYLASAISGKLVRRLSPSGVDPDWAPDGRRLVFVRSGELYSVRRDGSGMRRLTYTGSVEGSPAYSPDGKRIAFVRYLARGEEDAPREEVRDIAVTGGSSRLLKRLPSSSELGSAPVATQLSWQPLAR